MAFRTILTMGTTQVPGQESASGVGLWQPDHVNELGALPPGTPVRTRGTYYPLLGTNVSIAVTAATSAAAEAAEATAADEMVRLQALLTIHDPASEISRWRAGELEHPGPELTAVLALAADFWTRSGGAFHPGTRQLTQVWRRAADTGTPPSDAELAALASGLRQLPYRFEGGTITRRGDCSAVDLNAVAKGWIVDQAVAAALTGDVLSVVVNAGGDLRHAGEGSVSVAIADPLHPGRTLDRVALSNAGLATSGPAFRGFQVGERWYGHVLDPRTGWPVESRPSTSVLAATAAIADAAATVLGVLDLDAGQRALGDLDGLGVLAQLPDGTLDTRGCWPDGS